MFKSAKLTAIVVGSILKQNWSLIISAWPNGSADEQVVHANYRLDHTPSVSGY